MVLNFGLEYSTTPLNYHTTPLFTLTVDIITLKLDAMEKPTDRQTDIVLYRAAIEYIYM